MVRAGSTVRVFVDAFDNFSVHPELRPRVRQSVDAAYRRLFAVAERISVNSHSMQDYVWRVSRREALLVPNGVDPSHFVGATPMLLPDAKGRIVGYAGKLGARIDVELLCALADALTDGTIVLAGQILNRRWVRQALVHPRVVYIGDVHYNRLPSFLAACNVCIVPHRVGEGENQGDPTKIYEYLAAGRPVITTAIEGTAAFQHRVVIALSRAEFVEATIAATRGESVIHGAIRLDETWGARTHAIRDYFGLA
jgi:glycosyltransferase involved in cell wall biosynthesis